MFVVLSLSFFLSINIQYYFMFHVLCGPQEEFQLSQELIGILIRYQKRDLPN
jgi:hypothetical protein